MQNAECKMQNGRSQKPETEILKALPPSASVILHSAFCILHFQWLQAGSDTLPTPPITRVFLPVGTSSIMIASPAL